MLLEKILSHKTVHKPYHIMRVHVFCEAIGMQQTSIGEWTIRVHHLLPLR